MTADPEDLDAIEIPGVDIANDPVDLLARRAVLQAHLAEQLSRRALGVATETADKSWTREQHLAFGAQLEKDWSQMRRSMYSMFFLFLILTAVGFVLASRVFGGLNGYDTEVQRDLDSLSGLGFGSCEVRNLHLETETRLYTELAQAMAADPELKPQVEALDRARNSLPRPVNCAPYDELSLKSPASR